MHVMIIFFSTSWTHIAEDM